MGFEPRLSRRPFLFGQLPTCPTVLALAGVGDYQPSLIPRGGRTVFGAPVKGSLVTTESSKRNKHRSRASGIDSGKSQNQSTKDAGGVCSKASITWPGRYTVLPKVKCSHRYMPVFSFCATRAASFTITPSLVLPQCREQKQEVTNLTENGGESSGGQG